MTVEHAVSRVMEAVDDVYEKLAEADRGRFLDRVEEEVVNMREAAAGPRGEG